MRHLIELSGESESLAKAESLAVASMNGKSTHESDGRALILETDTGASDFVSRLSLAWSVSEHIFSCGPDELDSHLENLQLPGKTFRVRTSRLEDNHVPEDGRKLASHIGQVLSARYGVNLEIPDMEVRVLMSEKYHVGILSGEIDRSSFESRKPENRPYKHPISLHPKLARALVNLTGVRNNQTLLDPFCGTGGILLEAGLIGCHPVGGDIDERMVNGSLQNLSHFGIENPDIRIADISSWPKEHAPVDAIATDPPYGRSASTAREPIELLYKRAFAACYDVLKDGGRLAIVLPSEKHLSLAEGFDQEEMHPVRVHRSLTRYFCVFRK